MTMLGHAHTDIEQDIECLNSQKEDIMATWHGWLPSEELKRVRKTMEEKAGNLSKDLY